MKMKHASKISTLLVKKVVFVFPGNCSGHSFGTSCPPASQMCYKIYLSFKKLFRFEPFMFTDVSWIIQERQTFSTRMINNKFQLEEMFWPKLGLASFVPKIEVIPAYPQSVLWWNSIFCRGKILVVGRVTKQTFIDSMPQTCSDPIRNTF